MYTIKQVRQYLITPGVNYMFVVMLERYVCLDASYDICITFNKSYSKLGIFIINMSL